ATARARRRHPRRGPAGAVRPVPPTPPRTRRPGPGGPLRAGAGATGRPAPGRVRTGGPDVTGRDDHGGGRSAVRLIEAKRALPESECIDPVLELSGVDK